MPKKNPLPNNLGSKKEDNEIANYKGIHSDFVPNSNSNLDRKFVPICYSPNFMLEIPHASIPTTYERF